MSKFITLLKGINVGGHKIVAMADLRQLMTKEGFQKVQTYIQSGNIIFDSLHNTEVISNKIQKLIRSHFKFEVSVIVKTPQEILDIFEACPLSVEKK